MSFLIPMFHAAVTALMSMPVVMLVLMPVVMFMFMP